MAGCLLASRDGLCSVELGLRKCTVITCIFNAVGIALQESRNLPVSSFLKVTII
jgi:hypothetical protein